VTAAVSPPCLVYLPETPCGNRSSVKGIFVEYKIVTWRPCVNYSDEFVSCDVVIDHKGTYKFHVKLCVCAENHKLNVVSGLISGKKYN